MHWGRGHGQLWTCIATCQCSSAIKILVAITGTSAPMQTAHTLTDMPRRGNYRSGPQKHTYLYPQPRIKLSNKVAAACLPAQLPGSMHSLFCHRWQLLNTKLLNFILSCILRSLHPSTPITRSPAKTKKSKMGEEHDRAEHGTLSNVIYKSMVSLSLPRQ